MPRPAILLAGLLAAAAAAADDHIEEVVVTAEFRAAGLDSLPASIAVLDGDAVARRDAQHLEEALAMAANLNVASGANRARFIQIRGIGERGQFREPLNPSVGLLVDGIDVSSIGTAATLFDLDQVEVFRGPQGTLYGAYALAGLVNVTTAAPTAAPEASVTAGAANYGGWRLGGVVSGPLNDRLLGRLAVQQHESDGFIDNSFLDRDDTSHRDEFTLRGKLRWLLGDELTVDATLLHVDMDNGYDAFSLDNNRTTRSDEPGNDQLLTTALGTALEWTAPDGYDLGVDLGLAVSEVDYSYDEDWTFDGFHPFGYSSTDSYQRDRRTLNLDVRLLSDDDGLLFDGRSAWVVGLYHFRRSVDLARDYTFAAGRFTSRFETRRTAVYGQLDTTLTERLGLVTGLRLERQRSAYRDSDGARFRPDEDFWGARAALTFAITDNQQLYAAASRGFKAGGFNTDGTLPAAQRTFDAETLVNLELGLKGAWLDGSLRGRVALFAMERDDVQLDSSLALVRNDGSTEFIDFIGNAGSGFNRGAEVELSWLPTEALTLDLAVGLLDTEFEDYDTADAERRAALDGREQPQAPEWTLHSAAEYRFGNGLFARAEVEGRDGHFFSTSHEARSDSYTLVHLSAGIERERWSLVVWGRNVGDEDHAVRGFRFGNDPRDNYAERTWLQLGEPRRYGATVTVAL